ncbi:LLM class flavin-dependent oxidoreductase [Gryllotalpicola ginsengisoli]|uniref:LLM class flavin-dependent oxidoreductase n=1 Tax=Gryllotalpicola ginsengisoli TaxID=444608 RepID=UPI0003B507EA|nr:LLM class flavin-dependent oxidoreductase [Gryllotalpicola ginsengisoli]
MTALADVPLNVLDLAWRGYGQTNADAVAASVAIARRAEELGYHRYWFAEHHGMPGIASSSPAVLIGAVAAVTERMRVGSGGVMLPNHAPLVVAEQFGTLKALYGDRIDLGLGRAPGTDGATALALRRTKEGLDASTFPQELLDLIGFFHGGMSPENPMSKLLAVPGLGDAPEIWLLGSSGFSAQVAGALGLPFAFAHHFSSDHTEQALGLYREAFRPSEFLEAPHAMIAVTLITDESPDVVRREMLPGAISFIRMRQGHKPEPVSVDEALAYEFSPLELEFIAHRNARQAIGTPAEVKRQLLALLDSTGVDELMLQPAGATAAGRVHSLELAKSLASPSASSASSASSAG